MANGSKNMFYRVKQVLQLYNGCNMNKQSASSKFNMPTIKASNLSMDTVLMVLLLLMVSKRYGNITDAVTMVAPVSKIQQMNSWRNNKNGLRENQSWKSMVVKSFQYHIVNGARSWNMSGEAHQRLNLDTFYARMTRKFYIFVTWTMLHGSCHMFKLLYNL